MPALSTPPAPSATVGGPGPTGPAGQSAYTFTTAPVSAYNGTANLVVSVQNVSFLGLTSPVFIPNVGGFEVNAISGTQLTLLPLNIIGTAPFNIPSGTMVASAGYPGLNGATGSTGPQGIAGPQGPVGPQGLQGPAGQAGATGPTGPQGATGQQGTQGPPGTTGATGATGPQGPIGVKGDPGPQGTQGIQGVSGPQGPTGPIGATGPIGPQGNPGPAVSAQGAWTPSGVYAQGDLVTWNNLIYIGLAASQNAQPDQHPTLWAVYSSIGIQGPQGATGPAGPPGAPGAQGVAGPQGPIGADGATGATGPAGSPGPTGNTGPQGAQGPTGATGPMGPTGPQGVPGPSVTWRGNWTAAATYNPNDGVSYQGNSYVAISTNVNAPPPTTAWQLIAQQGGVGPQGPIGNTGPIGPIGPTGATGSQGPTGPAGATGPPGPTAVSGNAGNTAMLGTDNLLFVPATPLATTTKQGSIVQLSGNATQVLLGTNAFGAVPLSTTGNQGGIIAITNSATDVLLGTNAFGAVPAATASKAGGIPALSGNTTDFLDGTNHFQNLASAITPLHAFVSKTAAYTLTVADSSKYVICSGGSWTLTLPAPAVGLNYRLRNDMGIAAGSTTGTITVSPTSGTIDGQASINLLPQQECTIITDGANWRTYELKREVVLGTQDITAATASAVVLLPVGYRYFELALNNIAGDTTATALTLNFSSDGGATFKTDATYARAQINAGSSTTVVYTTNNTDTSARVTITGTWGSRSQIAAAYLKLWPGNGTNSPTWQGESWLYSTAGPYELHLLYGGNYGGTAPIIVNAVRYQMTSGNIASSQLTVKGVV